MKTNKWVYEIDGSDFNTAGEASEAVKGKLQDIELPADLIRRVVVAMYEGEINVFIHADSGIAEVEVFDNHIDVILIDNGPGIDDIGQAMQEGFSTATDKIHSLGFGAGMGLPNMKRFSDDMNIVSDVGRGTTIYMRFDY